MERLIDRLRQGDEQAFEELFSVFFASGRRFVASFLPADATSDDIVQEVFIQVWNRRHIFKSEAHFKAYFYKALRNNTLKQLTRTRPQQELDTASGVAAEDMFIKIVEVEFQREVARAIATLPEKRREVIVYAIQGMSIEEIAERLGISPNTVKVQKRKAYAALREQLHDIDLRILSIFI
jgi:RNA polymerase sigma-70 factor (ECF subfamily)